MSTGRIETGASLRVAIILASSARTVQIMRVHATLRLSLNANTLKLLFLHVHACWCRLYSVHHSGALCYVHECCIHVQVRHLYLHCASRQRVNLKERQLLMGICLLENLYDMND